MKTDTIPTLFGLRTLAAIRIAKTGVVLATPAALGTIPGWEPMLGFLGFLGLIGIATMVEAVNRRGSEPQD